MNGSILTDVDRGHTDFRIHLQKLKVRVSQSPAQLLTGVEHPHWLAMLGNTRISRN